MAGKGVNTLSSIAVSATGIYHPEVEIVTMLVVSPGVTWWLCENIISFGDVQLRELRWFCMFSFYSSESQKLAILLMLLSSSLIILSLIFKHQMASI